jgi:monofunctional biosynthetic peptidoglycan transglycosylase
LAGLGFINPGTTALQIQRRVEAWLNGSDYDKRSVRVPLARISPHLQHSVIAAEDGRFYQHYGIDWRRSNLFRRKPPRLASRRAGRRPLPSSW